MQKIQLLAAAAVGKVLAGRNLNQVLSATLGRASGITAQQQGALQDLSYGTLRYYAQLAALLRRLLLKPLRDQHVNHLLLVALYQLQYSKAAPYAVVDQAVAACRQLNPAMAGLVNAVLRNFLRKRETLWAHVQQDEEARHAYPRWWIDKLYEQYGRGTAQAIMQAGNQHPPMTLRVNRRQATAEAYLAELSAQGIAASLIEPAGAVLLERPVSVDRLPGFAAGKVSVQDAGAQYAALLLDVQDGMRVLDACAAPGGKTTHLLELADVELLALDVDEERLVRVNENLQRLCLSAQTQVGDAGQPQDWWDGRPFDRILADVPCSASGVVKRHPDIKWLRRPNDIAAFAAQQQAIVESLWPLLRKGGKLLYATCSIFAEENEQIIMRFLAQHADAVRVPVVTAYGGGQLLPDAQHDGFFYGLLHKAA